MKNNIPLVFCFDDNYLLPALISIYSLLKNSNGGKNLHIYILHNKKNLSQHSIDQILLLKSHFGNCNFYFIDLGNSFIDHHTTDLSIETYFRLAIPDYLHNYDKVIYCDSDTIFINDISELYQTNINNYSLAAVKESLTEINPNYKYFLKKNRFDPDKYFNAGLLIFNNKKINHHKIFSDQIKTFSHKKFRYADQDILNTIFKDDVYYLDASYNYTSNHLKQDNLNFPKIIHYIYNKPWKEPCAFSDIWWSYYRTSPFYDEQYYLTQTSIIYEDIKKHLSVGNKLKNIGAYHLIIKIKGALQRIR
ncbi:glycosyltransferase family 8 protein [Saccharicrinis sp. 156]|uniref:glycosyltransferase family 8 protein n=1 Tax=Saccharicrinis sp. 156 TaxID=3417574 RepID=UPI003D341426